MLLLCELDAELREVFPSGGQIVSDDRYVLFDVHDDGRHVRTLVAYVLHALPWHLRFGRKRTDRSSSRVDTMLFIAL